jgi:hypothetical protein
MSVVDKIVGQGNENEAYVASLMREQKEAAAKAEAIEKEQIAKNTKTDLDNNTILLTIVSTSRFGVNFALNNANEVSISKISTDSILRRFPIKVGDVITRINDFTITHDTHTNYDKLVTIVKNEIIEHRKNASDDNPLRLYIKQASTLQGGKSRKSRKVRRARHYKNTKRRRNKYIQ